MSLSRIIHFSESKRSPAPTLPCIGAESLVSFRVWLIEGEARLAGTAHGPTDGGGNDSPRSWLAVRDADLLNGFRAPDTSVHALVAKQHCLSARR